MAGKAKGKGSGVVKTYEQYMRTYFPKKVRGDGIETRNPREYGERVAKETLRRHPISTNK